MHHRGHRVDELTVFVWRCSLSPVSRLRRARLLFGLGVEPHDGFVWGQMCHPLRCVPQTSQPLVFVEQRDVVQTSFWFLQRHLWDYLSYLLLCRGSSRCASCYSNMDTYTHTIVGQHNAKHDPWRQTHCRISKAKKRTKKQKSFPCIAF